MPYVESGHVYPTRQSFTTFVAKDQNGEVYRSVIIEGQENRVISMIYQYRVNSINLADIRAENNELITTIVTNKFQQDYTCNTVNASGMYTNTVCNEVVGVPDKPELPEGEKVPTLSEWSIILLFLLFLAAFKNRFKKGVVQA
jgi:hypothetical protein